MAPPPEAHNSADGAVYGHLVQAREIHGGITLSAPRAPVAVPDVSLDPPLPATAPRGRDDLLAELRDAMGRGAPVPYVLTGPGGFGKTTVAAALAEHARSERRTVFWVRPDAILPSMLEIAVELGGSREEAEKLRDAPRQAARWVWRHLDAASDPWLLVIDNADRPEELDPRHRPGEQRGWVRSSPGGFVLVTSRMDDPALWAPAKVRRVGVLEAGDAATALADHAGTENLPGAEGLAERLGGVPLALFLAGRILATHYVLFPDADSLLGHLDGGVSRLDELSGPLVAEGDAERRLLSGVWDLSLRMVGEQNPQAVPLLKMLALLGHGGQRVPLRRLPVSELSGGTLDTSEHPFDEASFARTVNALTVHGLVRVDRGREETALGVHPLVSETVSAQIEEGDLPLALEVERLLEWQNGRDPWFELGALAALELVYTRCAPLSRHSAEPHTRIRLASGHVLLLLGRFTEAESVLGEARSRAKDFLGPDHPLTLWARHLLAESWLFQERVQEAEQEYLALLPDRRRVLGAEHPTTLDTLHQIALVAGMRGDWSSAREQHEGVLAARLRGQGPEAAQTLASMDALGYAAMHDGDLDAAEPLFREVHETRRRVLGPDHRLTLNAEYKLGLVALRRGDRLRARLVFETVLAGRRRILGEDHPQTRLVRDRLRGIVFDEPRAGGAVNSG